MADHLPNAIPDAEEVRARWGDLAWTDATAILGSLDIVFGEIDR